MRVDSLEINAVVSDDYTDNLVDLADALIDVGTLASRTVENIVADVDVSKALGQLETLDAAVRAVDDDIDISASGGGFNVGDGGESPFTEAIRDGFNSLDIDQSVSVSAETAVDGGLVTPDGGDTDTTPLRDVVSRARDLFGDSFDASALIDDGDRINDIGQLIEGDLSDYIDGDAVADAIIDSDDNDITTFDQLSKIDLGDQLDGVEIAIKRGDTDLPTSRFFSRNFGSAGDKIDGFIDSVRNFDATALNNLRASLFPLLATFIGALPAAIAGVIGLAGAALSAAAVLGSVFAVGALGIALSDDITFTDIFEDVRQTVIETFGPIADTLTPTFLRGVDSVQQFIQELSAIGPQLQGLSDDALNVLDAVEGFLLNAIPNVLRFGELAIRLFGDLSDRLEGFSLTRALADVLAVTIDDLILFANAIIRVIPFVIELSEGFLIFASILLYFIGIIGQALNQFPLLTTAMGALIAFTFTLVSATLLLSSAYNILTGSILAGIVPSISAAIGAMKSWLLAKYAAIVASYGLTTAIITTIVALSALTLGLFAVASAAAGAASKWSMLGNEIGGARREMRRFGQGGPSGPGAFGGQSGQGRGYTNYVDNSETTVVADSAETGGSVSRQMQYNNRVRDQHTS